MEIRPTADQEAFIREGIASGRYRIPEDALNEALALWEERERARAELLAAVDLAEASLARGEGRDLTEASMRDMAAAIKARGRIRLASRHPR
jgi:Arc/MetJ-type ribon-helix-helix transcriptional regulator